MKGISELIRIPTKSRDKYLDDLLEALNSAREGTSYKPITYARLQMMLKKFGKSKKNWDRSIFIADVLDAKNPSKVFWGKYKQLNLHQNSK